MKKEFTKKDIDEIRDNFILFAKIFLPDFKINKFHEELMRRFLDVEAKEMRYSYQQILNTHPSCHKMWETKEEK